MCFLFSVCYCLMQQENRTEQKRREAITSYLKPPAFPNNMGDNTISSPTHGLGFITSHVC